MPEIRHYLLIITGWGESGKVILQVSIAVFGALSKNFSGKDGSAPPPEKIGLYAYAYWSPVSIQILKFIGNKMCTVYTNFQAYMELYFTENEYIMVHRIGWFKIDPVK